MLHIQIVDLWCSVPVKAVKSAGVVFVFVDAGGAGQGAYRLSEGDRGAVGRWNHGCRDWYGSSR